MNDSDRGLDESEEARKEHRPGECPSSLRFGDVAAVRQLPSRPDAVPSVSRARPPRRRAARETVRLSVCVCGHLCVGLRVQYGHVWFLHWWTCSHVNMRARMRGHHLGWLGTASMPCAMQAHAQVARECCRRVDRCTRSVRPSVGRNGNFLEIERPSLQTLCILAGII